MSILSAGDHCRVASDLRTAHHQYHHQHQGPKRRPCCHDRGAGITTATCLTASPQTRNLSFARRARCEAEVVPSPIRNAATSDALAKALCTRATCSTKRAQTQGVFSCKNYIPFPAMGVFLLQGSLHERMRHAFPPVVSVFTSDIKSNWSIPI